MDVTRVPVETTTRGPGGRTNAYLLGSDSALLVDPADSTDPLDDAVSDCAVTHVAVTHHHPDHVGAVATYADRCDATVWAHAAHADRFESTTGVSPDRTFRHGTTIDTDQGAVRVRGTPGHAPEHVTFECDAGAVVGDLAVAAGSVVVGGPDADMRAYLTSLRRVHAQNPEALYPGHGPTIEDARGTLERLVVHRIEREARILAAVESGAETIDEILDAAYDKDLGGVRDLARATVRCHLQKLAVEGDLVWDGDRAALA
ncbi:MBL fold metallo-hydrolase [Halorientalis brevis]|uniref:MBL fold metallo-hydrolase n=1 Tax=Halorientalis brevis TaxID=1126241 RepID=A0ABD6C987_9EURY|nr:MBL fold metallo-hydrolase [Halorientalis brevis]